MSDQPEAFTATMVADIRTSVTLPDRELTAEERTHLGLPQEG